MIKKIVIFIACLLLGLFLFVLPGRSSVLQVVFLILFVFLLVKTVFYFSKKILGILAVVTILYLAFVFVPFPECDASARDIGIISECNCLGFEKWIPMDDFSHTECVGLITEKTCYDVVNETNRAVSCE